MRSVTLRAFFGFVRKRSRGDLKSGTSGLGDSGVSMEAELSLSKRLSGLSTMRFGVSQYSFRIGQLAQNVLFAERLLSSSMCIVSDNGSEGYSLDC